LAEGLTIHEAAETTGWSPRMLRYVDRVGLVSPPRTASGYRIYRAEELQRLRTLRELLNAFELGLSEVAFAGRMRADDELRERLEDWFRATPSRPHGVEAEGWLRWEQQKHQRLLAA
jgi:DNA-binding transcriptional MerR regulator